MAGQVRENGSVSAFQNLSGHLEHYIIDAGKDVSVTGYDTATNLPQPGEELFQLISDVTNVVIAENASANVWHVAVEINGLSTTDVANVINGSATFSTATVTAGTYTVA
jgi:hypothetical protein